jgi:nucleotide-binding universal stress UspA family protein
MNLLVPHDGSQNAAKALDHAVELAGKYPGSKINVVIVVADLCLLSIGKDECDALTGTLRKEAEGIKTKISDKLAAQNIPAEVTIQSGTEAESILASADQVNADFIIIGAAGKHAGAGSGALGSVANKVVNNSKRSVIVIR